MMVQVIDSELSKSCMTYSVVHFSADIISTFILHSKQNTQPKIHRLFFLFLHKTNFTIYQSEKQKLSNTQPDCIGLSNSTTNIYSLKNEKFFVREN